jgi:DNA-binding NarL/FixJ family response regulator
MISVLLVDDHAVLRAGLRSLLDAETDIEVVGEASCGEEAIDVVREREPNVVVMDLSMPGIGGLEATRRIRALDGDSRVIVLTMHSEQEHLGPVIEAGASGYLTKTRAEPIESWSRDCGWWHREVPTCRLKQVHTSWIDTCAGLNSRR